MEYWECEPFGDEWLRTAHSNRIVLAAAGVKKLPRIDELMPGRRRPDKKVVSAQVFGTMMALYGRQNNRLNGGSDSRNSGSV